VYEAYLKGRYEWNQRTPESLHRAIAHFGRAVALDPTYAAAHAALADCYNQLGTSMVSGGSPRRYRPLAAAAAIRALQIDPYSAEAHAALGYVHHYEWRWADAEHEFRRAIELNPSYPLVRIWYANLLVSRRRIDDAVREVIAARDLDPLSLVVTTNVGWTLAFARRHDEAIEQFRRTLELDSTYVQARTRLVASLMAVGRADEALAEATRVVSLTDRGTWPLTELALVYVGTGRRAEARAVLNELLARSRREYVAPWALVRIHDALGDVDEALAWAQRAFEERSNGLAYAWTDLAGSPLHADPRFQALLARGGLR
jgi:tetratricopeptide (TPR) repeat protein